MKLVGTRKEHFTFSLNTSQRRLMCDLLQLYPVVPAGRQVLSRNTEGPEQEENQRLLDESLAEQRRANRREVQAMLSEPGRFRETKTDVRFTVSRAQMEWLLQVFNDVRVGAWLALGEPKAAELPEITKANAPYLMAMEASGFFESRLLAALGIQEREGMGEDEE